LATILQFGTGRCLRGFFCPVIAEPGSIVVVQARPNSSGAETINQCPNRNNGAESGYHVWTRGKIDGQVVDQVEQVHSIERAVVAHAHWSQLLDLTIDPGLQLIVSNTTEQGLALDSADDNAFHDRTKCPASYPAKLLALLHHRYESGLDGLTILPLELVEYNANRLLQLVLQQAAIWPDTNDSKFITWLETRNRWLNNLVDRIVVGVSESPPWTEEDSLAVVGEPYRLLAIEDDGGSRLVLPSHPMIQWVPDLNPIFVRKVRILNGLHTAMVAHSLPQGFETVLQAVSDPDERAWLDGLLNDEILPALAFKGHTETEFAAAVMDRFENPFFQHRLADIANGHAAKLKTRIQPTIDDFHAAFGRNGKSPEKLLQVMAGLPK